MNEKQYKRVFILGSGFSKSFCSEMPTMKNLEDAIFKKERIGPILENYDTLFQYVEDFNKIDKSGKFGFKSIENLVTTIFSRRIFGSFSDEINTKELQYQILRYIYNSIHPFHVDDEAQKIMLNFLKICGSEHYPENSYKGKNLIVTYNYDLLMEEILRTIRTNYHIDYSIELANYTQFSNDYYPSNTRPLQILKLHGSFNWFQTLGSANIDISSIFQVDPWDENHIIYSEDNPLFIPMSHGKEIFLHGSLYNFIWAKAFNYIADADEIYVIGYGFPDSDINNLLYIYPYQRKIKKIVVLYENETDSNYKKLVEIFGKNKILIKDAKEFIEENYRAFYSFNNISRIIGV